MKNKEKKSFRERIINAGLINVNKFSNKDIPKK